MAPDDHEQLSVERLRLRLAAETLPREVDPDRFASALREMLDVHPDRSVIVGLLMLEARLFVVPKAGELEVRLGFPDTSAPAPPGAEGGEYITLGAIPLSEVLPGTGPAHGSRPDRAR